MDPRFRLIGEIILGMLEATDLAVRETARAGRRIFPRRRRGRTLRPGPATPMWNILVDRANRQMRVRGSKAHLARLLGVPRQRIQECLKARTACLDAERTLMLLCWLAGQARGRPFAVPEAPP